MNELINQKQVKDVRKHEKRENYIHGMTNISFLLLVLKMMENVVSSRKILAYSEITVVDKICQKIRLHLTP